MAHAAEINPATGEVIRVIVVSNDCEPEVEGWCVANYGGVWKQTSYNHKFRRNFAGQGFTYRADLDAFVPPRPYPSWTLNESVAKWEPPTPRPEGENVDWDEAAQSWVQLPE